MMSFKKKAAFTAILSLIALMMVLAAGCTSLPAARDNSSTSNYAPSGDAAVLPANNAATLDVAKGASYGTGDQNPGSTGITVSGQGAVTLKPDVAYVTLGVEVQNADFAKASKANNDAMAKVIAAIKGFGIGDEDIKTTNYSINPVYDDKQKVTGYRVFNAVNVKVKVLDKLGDILTAATDAGANTSYGINFNIQDSTAAYNEALGMAMEKARARADLMAKTLGVTLGKVLTINESSYNQGGTFPGAESAMGDAKSISVPTASGQMDVTASVSVVYEIVK